MLITVLGETKIGSRTLLSEPGRRLLGYLITAPNPSSSRSEIAVALWPEASVPRDNLRNALADIALLVDEAGMKRGEVFNATRDTLSLCIESSEIDLRRFEDLVADADLSSALEAIDLHEGPLFAGIADDWVEDARRAVEEELSSALEIAAEGLVGSRPQEAIRLARRLLALNPISQQASRFLMGLLAKDGQGPQALIVYRELKERLQQELAIGPDEATATLFEEILRSSETRGSGARDGIGEPEQDRGLDAYVRRIIDEYDNHAEHLERRTLRIEPRLRASLKDQYLPVEIAEFNRSQAIEDSRAWLIKSLERGDMTTCVVLGDYGAGKSSLLWVTAVQLAKAFLDDPEGAPFPVLLSLRDVGFVRHGWETLRSLMVRQDLAENALSALRELNERGRVIFLLDGLDELGRGLTDQQLFLSWQHIREVVAVDSRLVITCRSTFFHGARQLAETIAQRQGTLQEALASDTFGTPQLFELRPWRREAQFERMENAWGANWRHDWNRLVHLHPALAELAGRPGFLQMVIDTRHLLQSEKDAGLTDLLSAHTELWISHEEPRSHLGRNDKRQLLEEVALELWVNSCTTIDQDKLRQLINKLAGGQLDSLTLRASEEDIAVCTQLEWSAEGYGFVSELHLAFAIASALASRCNPERLALFGAQRLGPEATMFFAELTSESWPTRGELLGFTLMEAIAARPYLGGNSGSVLAARGEDMSALKLAGSSLRGAHLTGKNLARSDFSRADLSQAALDGTDLEDADLSQANLDGTVFGDGGCIGIIRIDPGGEMFAMGDEFGVISLWDVEGRRRISTQRGHLDDVWALAWSPAEPTLLATGSLDRTVRFWERQETELHAREDLGELPHPDWVLGIAWSADGKRLATSCADGLIRVWRTDRQAPPREQNLGGDVHGVSWHPHKDIIAVATGTASVVVWFLDTGEQRYLEPAGGAATWSVAFSPDGEFLVSTNDDGAVRLWSTETWLEATPNQGLHDGPAFGCAWQPAGDLLATSGGDHVLRVWKIPELLPHAELVGHEADTWNISWHPSRDRLLSASDDATVRYWNPSEDGSPLHTLSPPPRCRGMKIEGASGLSAETRRRLIDGGAIL